MKGSQFSNIFLELQVSRYPLLSLYRDDDYNHCAIGKVTSSKISNKNTIDFQSSIANLPNPVVMPFTNWQVR